MKVILVQDAGKFGKSGSVIKVKDGFARNFLFPRNLAVPATPGNLKKVEQERKRIESMRQQEKELAENLAKRLSGMPITIAAEIHNEDQLYGSIGPSELLSALKEEGITELAGDAVILEEPIKATGVYEVKIKLHPEVTAKIKVWVVKK
ncbi:MAG: 50S ribosomal protein L9 [Candidatus Omnitrophota bacterium]